MTGAPTGKQADTTPVEESSNTGLIVGIAVGAAVLIGGIGFLIYKQVPCYWRKFVSIRLRRRDNPLISLKFEV